MLMTIQWGDVAWEKSPSDNCWLQGSPAADDGGGSSLFPDYGRCHCWLLIFLSLSVGARCWCSLCQSSLLVDGSVTLGESGFLALSLPIMLSLFSDTCTYNNEVFFIFFYLSWMNWLSVWKGQVMYTVVHENWLIRKIWLNVSCLFSRFSMFCVWDFFTLWWVSAGI